MPDVVTNPGMPANTPAATPSQAAPQPSYTIPVAIPGDLFAQLLSLSNENGVAPAVLCQQLIARAVNSDMLSSGVINDISSEAQELIKGLNLDAVLEALRIYNAAKGETPAAEVPAGDQPAGAVPVQSGNIVFIAGKEITDIIQQINARRVIKGLAPLEKSIAEVLYHYARRCDDLDIFEGITGMKFSTFKPTMKELALSEREANGAASNVIDTGNIFSSTKIVDTPVAALPGAEQASAAA